MSQIIILFLLTLVTTALAAVHYSLRFARTKVVNSRVYEQKQQLEVAKAKLKVVEEKIAKYVHSMTRVHHQVIIEARASIQELTKLLQSASDAKDLESMYEIEQLLDILEDRPQPMIDKIFESQSDSLSQYEHLRGWNARLSASLNSVVEEVVVASNEYNRVKQKKRKRRSTMLNLKAAGIVIPESH